MRLSFFASRINGVTRYRFPEVQRTYELTCIDGYWVVTHGIAHVCTGMLREYAIERMLEDAAFHA